MKTPKTPPMTPPSAEAATSPERRAFFLGLLRVGYAAPIVTTLALANIRALGPSDPGMFGPTGPGPGI